LISVAVTYQDGLPVCSIGGQVLTTTLKTDEKIREKHEKKPQNKQTRSVQVKNISENTKHS